MIVTSYYNIYEYDIDIVIMTDKKTTCIYIVASISLLIYLSVGITIYIIPSYIQEKSRSLCKKVVV